MIEYEIGLNAATQTMHAAHRPSPAGVSMELVVLLGVCRRFRALAMYGSNIKD